MVPDERVAEGDELTVLLRDARAEPLAAAVADEHPVTLKDPDPLAESLATQGIARLGRVRVVAQVGDQRADACRMPFVVLPPAPASPPDRPKKVFAHYMVCCPTAGGAATLDDYKREIVEAQKRGVDGFALNCGGWKKREPHYHARTLLMYEAAKQLGTDFQLFVSLDGEALAELQDVVRTLKDHPNQFRQDGRPVLSTFGGQGNADHAEGRRLIRAADDQPTIGLILCKGKDRLDVEYALRDVNKPMGVSSYITKDIPLSVQSQLPTVEEIEQSLSGLEGDPA